MGRRKKSKFNKWDVIVLFLIVALGIGLFYTYMERATDGIESYFSNAKMIFLSSLFYVGFFALVTGYVVSILLKKANS